MEKDKNGKELPIFWNPLYSMSKAELLVFRKTLNDYLDKGFIRVSQSVVRAFILFARNLGGGLRFCVDYRGLNVIIIKDRYLLTLIKEILRFLTKARWFTKIDISAVFHKIRIKKGDE